VWACRGVVFSFFLVWLGVAALGLSGVSLGYFWVIFLAFVVIFWYPGGVRCSFP
jgi:hypothetical protein